MGMVGWWSSQNTHNTYQLSLLSYITTVQAVSKQLEQQHQKSLTAGHHSKYNNNEKFDILWELPKYDAKTWGEQKL